jgi:hypothetical protein
VSDYSDGSHRDGLYKIFAVAGTIYRVRSVPTVVGDVDVDTPQDNFIRRNNQPGAPTTARPVFAVGTEAHLFMPSRVYALPYPDYDANLATTTAGSTGT